MADVTSSSSLVRAPSEAFVELDGVARQRGKQLPGGMLARHVLSIYPSADWCVQREALEALLRRLEFARRDELRLAERPSGTPFGFYRTKRPRRDMRPYRTLLSSLSPVRGSCDCPDFRRGSLGLCKHLLVVLSDLASRPRVLQSALDAGAAPIPRTRLVWDPIRPLFGLGDWMERVTLVSGTSGRSPTSVGERELARRFSRRVGPGAVLKQTHADDPRRRSELVEALLAFQRPRERRAETAEPGLFARLEEELERLGQLLELKGAKARTTRALRSLKRSLYPYQRDGVARFLAEGRLLLADDMGLGKTAQAIAACHVLLRTGIVTRGLLVVPASLKHQWQREWSAFSDAPVEVVDGSPADRAALYRRTKRGFLIANYEQVLRDFEHMQRWRPGLVVLDEAQRIKNWAAKTSHTVKELRPRYRLVLTGTPMENRLEELASIFDWVDDHALEPKWRLVPFHAVRADGEKALIGVRHLDVLRARMAHCTVRRIRREILDQLPPRTDTQVVIPLTAEQQEHHDELAQPISALLQRADRRPLTQPEFLRLMQLLTTQRIIANGLAQLDFAAVWPSIRVRRPNQRLLRGLFSPKLGELRDLVAQLVVEQGRKVVVFSQWRRMLSLAHWAIGDLLEEHGLAARFFTGNEGAKRRTQNLVDFHDDSSVRILFATDAGGVGLNLQRAANACINLELPWNPAVLEQRIGRIHRLGQTDPIDAYALVSAGSIEERIARLVADKQELFRGVFDGDSDAVQFESAGTFLEGVRRIADDGHDTGAPSQHEASDDDDGETDAVVDELVAAAEEVRDEPGRDEELDRTAPVPAQALPDAAEVKRLLSQIAVERMPAGGLRIEAPPEAADILAELFQGMASLLASAAESGTRSPPLKARNSP